MRKIKFASTDVCEKVQISNPFFQLGYNNAICAKLTIGMKQDDDPPESKKGAKKRMEQTGPM